jgi:hypothetical protein
MPGPARPPARQGDSAWVSELRAGLPLRDVQNRDVAHRKFTSAQLGPRSGGQACLPDVLRARSARGSAVKTRPKAGRVAARSGLDGGGGGP